MNEELKKENKIAQQSREHLFLGFWGFWRKRKAYKVEGNIRKPNDTFFKFQEIPCRLYETNNTWWKFLLRKFGINKITKISHIENQCKFIGELPNEEGLVMKAGTEYWLVFSNQAILNQNK